MRLLFPLSVMSVKEPDKDLFLAVGLTGVVAGIACVVFEIITVIKEQTRRRTLNQLT